MGTTVLSCCNNSRRNINESRPPPSRVRENGPDAGDDKIRINSSSLDHPVVTLADQSLEIVELAKTLYCTRVVRSAYWLNIDPTGMVEAVYRPELK